MPTAFIHRVRAKSTGWNGAPGLNTVYFVTRTGGVDSDPDDASALLCANRVHAAFDDAKGVFPSSWRLNVSPFVDVIDPLTGDLKGSFTVTPPAEIAGTSGSSYLPPSTMLLAQLRTNTFEDGRKLQGRAYLGPVSATIDGDGSPNSAAIALGVAWGAAILDAGIDGNPIAVVWRRPREARTLPTPLSARAGSYAAITSITTPDKYAVLRSRRD